MPRICRSFSALCAIRRTRRTGLYSIGIAPSVSAGNLSGQGSRTRSDTQPGGRLRQVTTTSLVVQSDAGVMRSY